MRQSRCFFNPERLYEAKIAEREKMTYPELTVNQSAELDDVLMVWFLWTQAYKEHLGVPSRSPYVQHTVNLENMVDTYIAEQVDLEIDKLPFDNRVVLGMCLRNRHNKLYVFKHPRYSVERMRELYRESKKMLYQALKNKNILKE